jgi:acetyl esterase/lipase
VRLLTYPLSNASSLPPRLPFLSDGLKAVERIEGGTGTIKHTIVAVSYRGYWTSRGRASQSGLELDAEAALQFVVDHFSSTTQDLRIVIWGQSIGSGIATIAAARYMESLKSSMRQGPPLRGLILETPFTSVNDMLVALYPQKWLPYRYLGIFLWNPLDSRAALLSMGRTYTPLNNNLPQVLILQAENDELVPSNHGVELEDLCKTGELDTERKVVRGALHTEVMARGDGRNAVAQFLIKIGK